MVADRRPRVLALALALVLAPPVAVAEVAEAAGIRVLPPGAAPTARATWGRPWIVARAGMSGPLNATLAAEIYVDNQWSVGTGVIVDPLALTCDLSTHWWPVLR